MLCLNYIWVPLSSVCLQMEKENMSEIKKKQERTQKSRNWHKVVTFLRMLNLTIPLTAWVCVPPSEEHCWPCLAVVRLKPFLCCFLASACTIPIHYPEVERKSKHWDQAWELITILGSGTVSLGLSLPEKSRIIEYPELEGNYVNH